MFPLVLRGAGADHLTLDRVFFLRKYVKDLQGKYQLLLKSTNRLAEGHLDVPIDEDVGIFEPIQDELKKIQKGFKKAVDEEVKNERMKTELVTNVSHDLRTPLDGDHYLHGPSEK